MMLQLFIEIHIAIFPFHSDFVDKISHESIMQKRWLQLSTDMTKLTISFAIQYNKLLNGVWCKNNTIFLLNLFNSFTSMIFGMALFTPKSADFLKAFFFGKK